MAQMRQLRRWPLNEAQQEKGLAVVSEARVNDDKKNDDAKAESEADA